MLHALGDPAWIVDAADLTLAGINRSALGLLALSEADLDAVDAMGSDRHARRRGLLE